MNKYKVSFVPYKYKEKHLPTSHGHLIETFEIKGVSLSEALHHHFKKLKIMNPDHYPVVYETKEIYPQK